MGQGRTLNFNRFNQRYAEQIFVAIGSSYGCPLKPNRRDLLSDSFWWMANTIIAAVEEWFKIFGTHPINLEP